MKKKLLFERTAAQRLAQESDLLQCEAPHSLIQYHGVPKGITPPDRR